MKTKLNISTLLLVLALAGCTTVEEGHDPVIVNAQRTMQTAKATFELIEKTELDVYPAFKAANPGMAAEVRVFVNKLRKDSPQWLATTYSLTETYRLNRNEQNKADLNTAVAILTLAIAKSNEYLAILPKG